MSFLAGRYATDDCLEGYFNKLHLHAYQV
jgi:hypothetical protein